MGCACICGRPVKHSTCLLCMVMAFQSLYTPCFSCIAADGLVGNTTLCSLLARHDRHVVEVHVLLHGLFKNYED